MPVDLVSGVAGIGQLPVARDQGSNVQQFTEMLLKMRAQKQAQALATLQFATDAASKGVTLPPEMLKAAEQAHKEAFGVDIREVEKIGKATGGAPVTPAGQGPLVANQAMMAAGGQRAPLGPTGALAPPEVQGPGQPPNPAEAFVQSLMGLASRAQERQGAELQRIQSETALTGEQRMGLAAERATKEYLNSLMAKISDPAVSEEEKRQARLQIAFLSNPSEELVAAMALEPKEQAAYLENIRLKRQGLMNREQKAGWATEMAQKGADMFGGDLEKARQYAMDTIEGKQSAIVPTPSPEFIGKNQELMMRAATLSSFGIPIELQRQYLLNGGDTSKIPGWPKTIATPEMINARANEVQAAAQKLQAETGAKSEPSASALRISEALKNLEEIQLLATKGDLGALQKWDKVSEILSRFGSAKNLDAAFLTQAQRELAPILGLQPMDMPGILWGYNTIYAPMTLPDINHPDVQNHLGLGTKLDLRDPRTQQFLHGAERMESIQPGTAINPVTGEIRQPGSPAGFDISGSLQNMVNQMLQQAVRRQMSR